jgi:hypothetical protein
MKNTLFTRIFENQILLLSVIVRVETGHRTELVVKILDPDSAKMSGSATPIIAR